MTTQHPSKLLGIGLVLAASFGYSLQLPFRHYAELAGVESLQLVFLATLAASLLMLPLLPWSLKNRPSWRGVLILAAARALALSGYFQALQTLPPSLAVMFFFSGPLMTLLQTAVFGLEKPTLIQILGFFIGIGGLGIALDLELNLDPIGIAWALLGGVGLSWEYLSARIWIANNKALSGTVLSVIVSNLFIIPFAWYFGKTTIPTGLAPWSPILLLAVLALILPTILLLKGIAHAGANTASLLALTEPVFTIIIAIAFGWDNPTLRTWLGMLLMLAALTTITLQATQATKKVRQQE